MFPEIKWRIRHAFLSDHSHRSEAVANQSSDIRANGNAITRSHPQCERFCFDYDLTVVPLFVANPAQQICKCRVLIWNISSNTQSDKSWVSQWLSNVCMYIDIKQNGYHYCYSFIIIIIIIWIYVFMYIYIYIYICIYILITSKQRYIGPGKCLTSWAFFSSQGRG